MTDASTFSEIFLTRLNQAGVEYMITGGVAATLYAPPRFTQDIDLVIELRPYPDRLHAAFDGERFYLPPVEVLEGALRSGEEVKFDVLDRDTNLRMDLYLLSDNPLVRWAFEQRLEGDLDGVPFWVAPPEYVIAKKVEYHSISAQERHPRDVAAILEESGDIIDRAVLAHWLDELGLREHWDTLDDSSFLPPPSP